MAKTKTSPDASDVDDTGRSATEEDASQEMVQQLQAVATESYEKLSEAAAQLAGQAQNVYRASETYVKEHPGAYVLGAFALGCFLGVLLGRE